MALPSNVSFGTVVGRFMRAVADGPDTGRDPDGIPLAGLTVKFIPSSDRFKNATATPPVMIVADPITATTDADGYLIDPEGEQGIRLLATDDEDLNPTGWTWGVAISGTGFRTVSFSFALPTDGTIDLATVVPVPGNPGQAMQDWLAAVEASQTAAADALVARDEAVAAKNAAEAVPTTNDGIMTSVAADAGSAFATQLRFSIDEAISEAGETSKGILTGLRVTKIDTYTTPFDGQKVLSRGPVYTTIWSTDEYVYVIEPLTIGATAYSRAARISKATGIADQTWSTTLIGHDSLAGHRGGTIAVDKNGTVIVHGSSHMLATQFFRSNTPLSIDAMTAVPVPTGATVSAYRRIFRDPHTGDLWLVLRGDDYSPRIYKWNETTLKFDLKASNPLGVNGGYGHDLAFAKSGAIYMAPEFYSSAGGGALSGYPRSDIGIVVSKDGGNTWEALNGSVVPAGTMGADNVTVLYPRPDGSSAGTPGGRSSATGRIGIASDGSPVVVALWRDPADTTNLEELSLWATRVDAYTGATTRVKLLNSPSANASAGQPWLAYNLDGYMVVIASAFFRASEVKDAPLYMFTTRDGLRWNRHLLDDGTNGFAFAGAQIDSESLRRDGLVRLHPYAQEVPSLSAVWEVHLTDSPQIEAGTSTTPYEPGPLYVTDFTAADGTVPTGWEYNSTAPDTNAFRILSNQLGMNTMQNATHVFAPPSQPTSGNHYAQFTVEAVETGTLFHPHLMVYNTGELDGVWGRYDPATTAWTIVIPGSGVVASFVEAVPSVPYTMRLEAVNGTVSLLVNGVVKVTHTPGTIPAGRGVALAFRFLGTGVLGNAQRVDNWEHGNI